MAHGQGPASVVEPSLASGEVLTPTIDVTKAPGVPAVQVKLRSGTVGADSIIISLASPSGTHTVTASIQVPVYLPKPKTDTIKFQVASPFANQGFGLYAEPGAWTISNLILQSNDGGFIVYSPAQLSSLFPSIVVNVTNSGTPDVNPPTIGVGKILTPTVSLGGSSPYFAARLPVADDVSGVTIVSLGIAPPAGSTIYVNASSNITLPVQKGVVTIAGMLPAGATTGTYIINSLYACDAAQNCLSEMTSAEIQKALGSTTFQVTN